MLFKMMKLVYNKTVFLSPTVLRKKQVLFELLIKSLCIESAQAKLFFRWPLP